MRVSGEPPVDGQNIRVIYAPIPYVAEPRGIWHAVTNIRKTGFSPQTSFVEMEQAKHVSLVGSMLTADTSFFRRGVWQ